MRRNVHTKLIKQMNIGTLLKQIRTHGPISRAELVKTSQLSPTTVSVLVEELLQAGLVREVGTGESSGGRRPILLEFQPAARLAVGIDIGVRRTTVALLDLDGNALLSTSYTPDLTSKESFLRDIVHHTDRILQASKSQAQNILGIGVATPGLVDPDQQSILYSSSLDLTDVPLQAALAERFLLPIRVDNDMNAAALGEKLMGAGKNTASLIYISVESGIGAGIIIDNRIYRGVTGSAGEFGHTTIEPAGPPCRCGNRGCLGVMAGEPALLSRGLHMLTIGVETKMRDYLPGQSSQVTLETIAQAARAGDEPALSIINECMDYLAVGIANLINMFDPGAIILGGSTMEALHPMALQRVRQTVKQRALPLHRQREYAIIRSELRDKVKIVGASTLIFSEFLDYAELWTEPADRDRINDFRNRD